MKAAYLNEKHTNPEGEPLPRWEAYVPVKEYYTIQDVCTILQVGGPSVYGAIDRGTLAGVKINGVKHVRHAALLAYMQQRQAAPVFDPSQLVIEEIIPTKVAASRTAEMVPSDREFDIEDSSFLDV